MIIHVPSKTIHLNRSMNMHKQNIQTLQYWQLFFDSIIFLSTVTDDEGCYFRTWHVNWECTEKVLMESANSQTEQSDSTHKICLILCFSCSFSVNRRDGQYEIEKVYLKMYLRLNLYSTSHEESNKEAAN